MSQWQALHFAAMLLNGAIVLFAAVAIDRANRNGGWYHGSTSGWRIVAAFNAVAFGFNGLTVAVLP